MLPLPGDRSAVGPEDETGLPHLYHIAVDELPTLYRGAVDGSAVGGPEIGESGRPSVPGDLQMPSRHARIGQPELGVMAAAHHHGALGELVVAVGPIVQD